MPTILRRDGFRLYFFSNEGHEPPHVHADRGGATAKLWLRPVALCRSVGFNVAELGALIRLVRAHRAPLEEAWHVHFGRRG